MKREEMATRIGFEPTISAVTGRHVDHYTTGPLNHWDENPRTLPAAEHGDVENRSPFTSENRERECTFASLVPDRAERECPICPPWVVRCAHYGSAWVLLHQYLDGRRKFYVCTGEQPATWGPKSAPFFHFEDDRHKQILVAENYDDALEAFYAAERELLAGGEA